MIQQGKKIKRRIRAGIHKPGQPIDCLQRPGAEDALCGSALGLASGIFIVVDGAQLQLENETGPILPIAEVIDCPECARIFQSEFK